MGMEKRQQPRGEERNVINLGQQQGPGSQQLPDDVRDAMHTVEVWKQGALSHMHLLSFNAAGPRVEAHSVGEPARSVGVPLAGRPLDQCSCANQGGGHPGFDSRSWASR